MNSSHASLMEEQSLDHPGTGPKRIEPIHWLTIAIIVLLLVFLGGMIFYHQREEQVLKQQAADELDAVSRLKIGQITTWRQERIADAQILAQSPYLTERFGRLIQNPDDQATRQECTERLNVFRLAYGYTNITLVDAQKGIAIDFFSDEESLALGNNVDVLEALNRDVPSLLDVLGGTPDNRFHLLLVIPASMMSLSPRTPGAGMVILLHPAKYLFPLIQSWPGISRTAETYLVRRMGDEAIILNEVRLRKGAELTMRFPMTQTEVTAVRAASGYEGLVEARDYRGEPVLSVVRSIADSPWFLVSEIDQSEAYAAWHTQNRMLLLMMGMTVLLIAGSVLFFFNQKQKQRVYELYRTESSLRAAELRHGLILRSIGDGVIVTDNSGHIRMLNPIAERLTGYSASDARGRPFAEVFNCIDEIKRTRLPDLTERVLREGAVVQLDLQAALIARDGMERAIADSAAPIRNEDGRLEGVVVVFRDQSRERAADRSLALYLDRMNETQHVAHIGSWDSIQDGPEVWWSDELKRMMEVDLQVTHVSRSFFWEQRVHPDDRAWLAAAYREAVVQRRLIDFQFRVVLPSGQNKYVEMQGHAEYADDDGRVLRTLGTIQDISRRKESEESLRVSEERWHLTFQASPDGFAITAMDGRFKDVSRTGLKLLGLSGMEEACSLSFMDFLDAADQARVRENIERLQRGEFIGAVEYTLVRRDGGRVPVEVSTEILRDSAGNPSEFIVAARDITERKQYEQQLIQKQQRLQAFIESSRTGTWEWGVKSHELIVNERWAGIVGYTRAELQPINIDTWIRLLHPDDYARFQVVIEEYFSGKRPHFEMEIRMKHKDGHWVWMYDSGQTVSWTPDGQPLRMIGMHQDITPLKEAEEQRRVHHDEMIQAQKLESIAQLSGGVAHDFNNLLQAILGFTELLLDTMSPDRPEYEDLTDIRKATQQAADLTHKLLTYSRRQIIRPVAMDLNAAISENLSMLTQLSGERIALLWAPGRELHAVRMDPIQLSQILVSLCANARDAIAGKGTISIETQNVSLDSMFCATHAGFTPGSYARISFRDSGVPLSDEAQARIFEPYYIMRESGRKMGLNLAMVHGAVKQNEGHIIVESSAVGGTSFHVYLPRCADTPVYPARVTAPAPEVSTLARGRGEQILLVDDELMILDIGKRMLTELGYVVTAISDTAQALKWAEEGGHYADLLLTDVIMPDMGGAELARRVTQAIPGIKCIYMSGYTADQLVENGILVPDIQFIPKPFSRNVLAARVRGALDAAEAHV